MAGEGGKFSRGRRRGEEGGLERREMGEALCPTVSSSHRGRQSQYEATSSPYLSGPNGEAYLLSDGDEGGGCGWRPAWGVVSGGGFKSASHYFPGSVWEASGWPVAGYCVSDESLASPAPPGASPRPSRSPLNPPQPPPP